MTGNLSWVLLVAIMVGCAPNSQKQESNDKSTTSDATGMDRTILPLAEPQYESISELDARNATAPAPYQIKAPEGAPNVVIVLIDDIGFSATETFGGAIQTPTFDRLADQGLRFNQFHTTALCSPTRAALKSGRNHHATNVGSVMEIATGFPGNRGQIPNSVVPLAEILRQNGFSTGAFGKWHETAPWEVSVSGPFDRWPTRQGFDKFYGFIGGETNQWEPLVIDGVAKVELEKDEDYHFTTDMTDQTIAWIKYQQAMTPDKPFMVYYATGATHAPHHAPQEWIDKYKGKFDDGWDALREETLKRQKEMGIIPENTKLAPKPSDLKDWDQLSDDEKKLFSRQMETFAAFASHTDHEVGRVVDAIDEIGELDNTIFVYIMGDNGSSGEGGFIGTYNELINLNGLFGVETIENMLEKVDDWGGPESFPHMSAAWAVATDVPFSYTKQVASDFGGTRNGMVIHYPNGFQSKGEIRNQWHHVNDVAPTILEACKFPEPKMVNGVAQRPMDGVSMLYCTDNNEAEGQHKTQYFEMFGNRALYHEGWLARTIHRVPWRADAENSLQDDVWELYNIQEDFSLTNDLAAEHPEKLATMRKMFDEEAVRNNVYPLDDRVYERFNAKVAGRPDLMAGRTQLTLAEGMSGIMENAFLNMKNTSFTIEAELDLSSNDRGIVLCQGGKFGGWAFYLNNGKPAYQYNFFGLERYTIASDKTLPEGPAKVRVDFTYDGDGFGKGGNVVISVNGEEVASGRVEQTEPSVFSADETADVGRDDATQVVPLFKDAEDSEFTGGIRKVVVDIDPDANGQP